MRDFNHEHIQWKSLKSTGRERPQFVFLIHDSFFAQHVLEPIREKNVLELVWTSQNE